MIGKRTKMHSKEMVLHTLGLPEEREMGRYLGVPLITKRLGPEHFTDIQNKVLACIGGWKNRLLS